MDNTFEKLTEILRNGILAAMDEDNRYLYTDVVDYMMAHGVTLDNQVSSSKWIPVSERLPENMDDRVLVLLPTKSYDYPIGNQHIDTDRYRGEYRKWVRYGDKVTHWMPLPEPPKEE